MKQKFKSLFFSFLVAPVLLLTFISPVFAQDYYTICQDNDPLRGVNNMAFTYLENGVKKLCCCHSAPGFPFISDPTNNRTFCPLSSGNGCRSHTLTADPAETPIKVPAVTPGTLQITNNNPFSNLTDVVSRWFTVGFYIAVVLAVLMVFYGGFSYAIAAGDTGKTGEAKNIILDAVIGLGVALLAGAILVFLRGPGVFVFQ